RASGQPEQPCGAEPECELRLTTDLERANRADRTRCDGGPVYPEWARADAEHGSTRLYRSGGRSIDVLWPNDRPDQPQPDPHPPTSPLGAEGRSLDVAGSSRSNQRAT